MIELQAKTSVISIVGWNQEMTDTRAHSFLCETLEYEPMQITVNYRHCLVPLSIFFVSFFFFF